MSTQALITDWTGDTAVLSAGDLLGSGVELDSAGLPRAFRVLRSGSGTFTLGGRRWVYRLTGEHVRQIVDYYERKGELIPIDAEHAVSELAAAAGLDETAATRLIGERAAAGFVRLTARADGLWAEVERWTPRAAFLLREKMYRYFSPVIRGLSGDGALRVTSLALTNVPALDGLEPLAATAERERRDGATNKEAAVDSSLLTAIAALLGLDGLSLSAEGAAPEGVVEKLEQLKREHDAAVTAQAEHTALLAELGGVLALGAEASPALVTGKVRGLVESVGAEGAQLATLKTQVETLRLAAETREKAELIAAGKATGKLTPSLIEGWAQRQDVATLRAFLDSAPVVVPPSVPSPSAQQPAAVAGNVAAIAAACGVDPKEVAARLK